MSGEWNEEGARAIADIARRNGFGQEAGMAMARALASGHGSMAQFSHPELGGMGQWSRGGMMMIGDMFNDNLKGRVGALADGLSAAMSDGSIKPREAAAGQGGSQGVAHGQWWPGDLGQPSSSGAQNGRRYAVFPSSRRLAVEIDGHVTLYDTGDHQIGGVSQQQGGASSLTFTSQHGPVSESDLKRVDEGVSAEPPQERPTPVKQTHAGDHQNTHEQSKSSSPSQSDVFDTLHRLSDLKDKGILSPEEFAEKKKELLGRL